MTIPTGFGQITYILGGTGLLTGAVCTMGFENTGAQTALACAQDAHARWDADLMPSLASSVQHQATLVKLGPDSTGASAVVTGAVTGGAGATSVSAAVCFLVHKQTNLGGRQGRGRMFIPGPLEAAVAPDGAIAAGTMTTVQAALTALIADATIDGMPFALLHDLNKGQILLSPTDLTGLALDSKVATQRRRQRR